MLSSIFADLHIHIGGTMSGKAVKITASRKMTLHSILEEASERKGMEMIGVIDAHAPEVQAELQELIDRKMAIAHPEGGIHYKRTMLLLGCEVEIKEPDRGEAHFLCYMPDLRRMRLFTEWLAVRCKNVHLSSQRVYTGLRELQHFVYQHEGLMIPAHIFTPHKGLYGSCTDHLSEVADPRLIYAVELGLSANTDMADRLQELHEKTFVTNSDAHSLQKIGREYQVLLLKEPSYQEWVMAMRREQHRRVSCNYGLSPQLGKYHQTACQGCGSMERENEMGRCPACGYKRMVRGVSQRIDQLADVPIGVHPSHRPSYVEQIPLEFLPGVGPKIRQKMYEQIGTEMDVLHRVDEEILCQVVGEKITSMIAKARRGELLIQAGRAGIYGKVIGEREK
ncbi:endonuclease Q family protein [Brevibacillus laterosporus]|uniref:TIGR00375 family protein n=1 Tax=Brevibacillus laterosporus TaxID=1465 RepID=A0AAP8QBG5_BRELA|nr:endonuclease Q family protein [Brevibacillus laterosporus]MED1664159.1 endonuclease Q family protein [Brevibacillus laterosporus]MED1670459.1 endonuclease Q family protein [Brevibacillus laterosporus]MED1720606.1 endonuclease Q family protein [Brevibacillus laterosporus]PPA83702.1 TIGR00375 family protein [Brevibacillus laterosporus]PPA93752.1 TIGR00375 family protein [Brevibacillus laterosporus]